MKLPNIFFLGKKHPTLMDLAWDLGLFFVTALTGWSARAEHWSWIVGIALVVEAWFLFSDLWSMTKSRSVVA